MLKKRTVILSAVMKWTTLGLALLAPALIVYLAVDHSWVADTVAKQYGNLTVASLPAGGRFWLLWAMAAIPAALWAVLLLQLYRLFDCFHRQQVFSDRMIGAVRAIGFWMIVIAFTHIVLRIAMSLVLTWDNPAGERTLAIALNNQDMMLGAFGVMMLLMGVAMSEASRLARENEQIV